MKRLFRIRDLEPDAERDVADELHAHLELKVEDLMGQGMTEEEARARALREMGGRSARERNRRRAAAETRARHRKQRARDHFGVLLQDLRYAVRRMARSPGFTAAALLSLAIGIGANTAVFSVVNTFLLRPLPYRAPQELVRIYTQYPGLSPWGSSAYPDYLDMRALDDVFADVGVYYDILAPVNLGEDGRMSTVEAISANLLPMLGVEPALGRGFLPEEDREPGRSPVAVLGYGFWNRAFGGDPGVLGRTIRIGGRPYTVVGVAPREFGSALLPSMKADLFVPVTMAARIEGHPDDGIYTNRSLRTYATEARLRAGITVQEARARMEVFAANLREAYPESNRGRTFNLLPAQQVALSPEIDQRLPLIAGFLLVVVGMVLLLACANLASFLLAQGVRRRREIGVRLALGAPRRRLVRQLLSETLLLGLAGGGAGLLLGAWTLGLLDRALPELPGAVSLDLGMDWRVLLFSLAISVAAGILFGLAPALQSTRPDVTPALKDSWPIGGRGRMRLRSTLVAVQMAVSVVLLVGGGLFVRALLAAESIDPGFSVRGVTVAWLDLAMSGVPRERRETTEAELLERLSAEPGVTSVAAAGQVPLAVGSSHQLFEIPGIDPPPGQEGHRILFTQVSPGFFRTLGIPIVSGRPLSPEDGPGAPGVVVVSEAMARAYWPGESPLGKQIVWGSARRVGTVVGVARDTKVERLGEEPLPFIYFSRRQYPTSQLRILVRGQGEARDLTFTVRRVLREVDPDLAVMEVRAMEDHLALLLLPSRIAALLLGAFGALALLLAAIGLYGVVSFSVTSRTREIGIRMSLGARGRTVLRSMIGGTLGVVALGGLVGLGAAYLLARVVQGFLFGVDAGDPWTLVGVPLALGGVALVAALVPARRATRVNPTEALRTE